MHKLYGDVSKEHRELAEELNELEAYLFSKKDKLTAAAFAKGIVCLSHDWFCIGADDKGSELLEMAEKVCPGYFDKEIKEQLEKDENYEIIVGSLIKQILAVARGLVDTAGDSK